MRIILKHGNTFTETKCTNCSCEFLYQHGDIQTSETRINAYQSVIDYKYVLCPECANRNKI